MKCADEKRRCGDTATRRRQGHGIVIVVRLVARTIFFTVKKRDFAAKRIMEKDSSESLWAMAK